jgi:hypothetical protein
MIKSTRFTLIESFIRSIGSDSDPDLVTAVLEGVAVIENDDSSAEVKPRHRYLFFCLPKSVRFTLLKSFIRSLGFASDPDLVDAMFEGLAAAYGDSDEFVKPRHRYLYHVANPANRKSIGARGLIPGPSEQRCGSYGCEDNLLFVSDTDKRDELFNSGLNDDIWRIDASKIPNDVQWEVDANLSDGDDDPVNIFTRSAIPANALTLVWAADPGDDHPDISDAPFIFSDGDFMNRVDGIDFNKIAGDGGRSYDIGRYD